MKRFTILIIFSVIISLFAFSTDFDTNTPPSFAYGKSLSAPIKSRVNFTRDVQELQITDMQRMKDGHPLRIAVGQPVDFNIDNSGQWLTLPSGDRIWQQTIESEGANGLIITFEKLYIPEGGRLFIYTADHDQLEIFDSASPNNGRAYATEILYQDEISLEYIASTISNEEPIININDVAYVYNAKRERNLLKADNILCYINVGCEEGEKWELQKDGVVGLQINLVNEYGTKEWFVCSGSLVNNVRQDLKPYILTADHCFEGAHTTTYETMVFDFFKESASTTDCKTTAQTSTFTKKMTGATSVASIPMHKGSDGTLLLLNENIPSDWDVYYNGWDASGIAATSGVSIHHPNGMVKKISTFTQPLKSVGNLNWDDGIKSAANGHWEVKWAKTTNGQSVTYGGSSGSPIFNEDGLIVGTLSGGTSGCTAVNGSDYYGKLSYHWDQYSNSALHFNQFLDPDNTGTLKIEGYDPHPVSFTDAPQALEASSIKVNSFTANWATLENATKYYLDVYTLVNEQRAYVDGYEAKNVGNVSSFEVTGLEGSVDYYYTVRAGAKVYTSGSSNQIHVKTSHPPLNTLTPVAKDASFVFANTFVANWEQLPDATSYILNVYQKVGDETEHTEIVDFTNQQMPEGWTTNASDFYTSGTYYGNASPAIKFGSSNDQVESPVYQYPIKELSFWYNGASAHANNYLTIQGFQNGSWSEIKRLQPIINSSDKKIVTITESEMPGCTAIRMVYTKPNSGNIAIDDITVTYGESPEIEYVNGYTNFETGNTASQKVYGLAANSTYYYTVNATDGALESLTSNEIIVQTIDVVDNLNSYNKDLPILIVHDQNIHVMLYNSVPTDLQIYNLTGQLVYAEHIINQTKISTRQFLSKGVYIVKIGDSSQKIIIK